MNDKLKKMDIKIVRADAKDLEAIVAEMDSALGLPKVGLAATGCRLVGAGPHPKDEDIKTTTSTVIVSDEDGPHIVITEDIESLFDSKKSQAQAKVQNGTASAKDALLASLSKSDKKTED